LILSADKTGGVGIKSTRSALHGGASADHGLAGAGGNRDDPLPYEIKAAKEGAGAEMAGAAKIDEKLNERLAELSEFAWELVDAGLAVAIAFAIEKAGAALGESEKDSLKGGGESLGFLFGVDAGAGGADERQGGTEDLGGFFVIESTGKFLEVGDAVGAIEEDVDGKTDAHVIGKFFEARAEFAGLRDDFVESGFANEFFAIDANDGGAGSESAAAKNGAEAAGEEMLNETNPGAGIVEQRAAGFDENGFAGEPKISDASGNDAAFLIDLASEQFGVKATLVHGAGFAAAGFANKKNRREGKQFGASSQAGRGYFAGGFANQNVHIPGGGSTRGSC
jgi:hypothetical protein